MANNLDLRLRIIADTDGRLRAVLSDAQGRIRNLGEAGFRPGQTGYRVHQPAKSADEFKTLQARLRQATDTQEEYNAAQRELFQIAQRTRSDLGAVVDLYARIGPALKEATGSQREALQVTESILKTIQLSGSDAAASEAAIRQLAQALQAGALKGDEFVSVMEGAPALMRAIADGMGVPIGKLKELASEGKLTAEVIAQSLQKQRALVEAEFGQLPLTVEQALTQVRNQFQQALGGLDAQYGVTARLAQGLGLLADNLDKVAEAGKYLSAILAGRFAQSLHARLREAAEGVPRTRGDEPPMF